MNQAIDLTVNGSSLIRSGVSSISCSTVAIATSCELTVRNTFVAPITIFFDNRNFLRNFSKQQIRKFEFVCLPPAPLH
jgi:hypothetical protein